MRRNTCRPIGGRWWVFACLFLAAALLPVSRGAVQAPFPSADPDEAARAAGLRRGEELAQAHCQSCHLLPEPDLLDKKSWADGPSRKMAPLFGVARLNLENRPDGQILKEANIFPASPIVSAADWKSIWDYYLAAAPVKPLPQGLRDPIAATTDRFTVELGSDPGVEPAITLVHLESATRRIIVGDARNLALHVLDAHGHRIHSTRVDSAPVSFLRDGDLTYVCLIGSVFPSDEKNGQLVTLREGTDGFSVQRLLQGLKRPVDCAVVDLNGDGRRDLAVAQFGNLLGRQAWFANHGGTDFTEESLWELPGGTRVVVTDFNRDSRPDLIYLMAQGREGVYLFENLGGGDFAPMALLQFPSIHGSTYFELADFNADGFPDLLVTNGDSGEYASPFKRYHGIRIYLNDGHFGFKEAWFFPLNGAFKAVARDFDGDGDLDIAAISFFPDYERSPEESFVYLENRGGLKFSASSVPEASAGRWLTMDAGDLNGDGAPDVVLGSFIDGPRSTPIPAALASRWATRGVSTLILYNRSPVRQ